MSDGRAAAPGGPGTVTLTCGKLTEALGHPGVVSMLEMLGREGEIAEDLGIALWDALTADPRAQPPPRPSDGPSMHDLVTCDLQQDYPAAVPLPFVVEDLAGRKEFGLARYGTPLQAHNGRDALRDLYDELLDASVYARQKIAESIASGCLHPSLNGVYDTLLRDLLLVRALIAAAETGQPAAAEVKPGA